MSSLGVMSYKPYNGESHGKEHGKLNEYWLSPNGSNCLVQGCKRGVKCMPYTPSSVSGHGLVCRNCACSAGAAFFAAPSVCRSS